MPIYEYQCTGCHHRFDLMQKFSDEPVTQCPKCFENTVIKLISAAGFQLKGTGWYVTDFKDKNANSTTGSTAASSNNTATTPTTTEKSSTDKVSPPSTDTSTKSTKGSTE